MTGPEATGAGYPTEVAPTDGSGAFEAPALFGPTNDHTASAVNVDVHNAVYHRPVSSSRVSMAARPTTSPEPHVAVDGGAWSTTGSR
jgi:hypothetical protein